MNNRLGDIPVWNDEEDSDEDDLSEGDIEQSKLQQPNYMENFFKEVDSIKADIDSVDQATNRIAEIHEQALGATTTDEETALSKQLKPLIEGTNKRAQRTKTLLGLLKEETEKLKAEGTLNASDIR